MVYMGPYIYIYTSIHGGYLGSNEFHQFWNSCVANSVPVTTKLVRGMQSFVVALEHFCSENDTRNEKNNSFSAFPQIECFEDGDAVMRSAPHAFLPTAFTSTTHANFCYKFEEIEPANYFGCVAAAAECRSSSKEHVCIRIYLTSKAFTAAMYEFMAC